jgi:glucose-1-phosphate thymidylyltransferase
MIFVKEVSDPARFGVVKFNEKDEPVEIVEKPKTFLSPFAITGMYVCDGKVSDIASTLTPSSRGEIEVTDIHNYYLKAGELTVKKIDGQWLDAGTIDSLHKASGFAKSFVDKGESYFKVLRFTKP